MRNRRILAMLVVSLLLGPPLLAADPMIQRGIDFFTTVADGKTSINFADHPIPAGFFCERSAAFAGRVALKGLPLKTEVPGQLKGADTVVERLDDAVFDAKGVAVTRLQFRALSLVSVAPVKTACGAFHVYVSLGNKQRVTKMTISRTQESGGSFVAPLAVDARVTFIPVKPARTKGTSKLVLRQSLTFPARPIPWSFIGDAMTKRVGSVVVDTNGDLTPDTRVPGRSNFLAGWPPDRIGMKDIEGTECPCWSGEEPPPLGPPILCHYSGTDHEHCVDNPCQVPPPCEG